MSDSELRKRIDDLDNKTIKVMQESSTLRLIASLNDNPQIPRTKKIRQVYDYASNSGYDNKQIRKLIDDCLIIGPGKWNMPRKRTPGKFFKERERGDRKVG